MEQFQRTRANDGRMRGPRGNCWFRDRERGRKWITMASDLGLGYGVRDLWERNVWGGGCLQAVCVV